MMDHQLELEFRAGLREATKYVYEWCLLKEWEPSESRSLAPPQEFASQIALIHSELSEALDAYRVIGLKRGVDNGDGLVAVDDYGHDHVKPEGVPSEFADVLVRLLHCCYVYNIDLGQEFLRKMRYNETRTVRHGGKTL